MGKWEIGKWEMGKWKMVSESWKVEE